MITKRWRSKVMSNERIVNNMIAYIEEEERNLQASKMINDNKSSKGDIVNKILDRLEREFADED